MYVRFFAEVMVLGGTPSGVLCREPLFEGFRFIELGLRALCAEVPPG